MAFPSRADEELKRLANIIQGYPTHAAAAAAIGLSVVQTRRILYDAREKGFAARADGPRPIGNIEIPEQSPGELRNAEFWRRKYREASAERDDAEHKLLCVSGLMERAAEPPVWAMPKPGKTKRAVGLLHI